MPSLLPSRPRHLLVVSAHWETTLPTVTAAARPAQYFDYTGFPPHTYELQWPAPGSRQLADDVRGLLADADIASTSDFERGLDHGVFIPLMLAFPSADIPTVQLSLRAGLDPFEHLAIGRALAPLRDRGVLIIGSGMSFDRWPVESREVARASRDFGHWLATVVGRADPIARNHELVKWFLVPDGLLCHPRGDHLMPLFVAAGAAREDVGTCVFTDRVLGVQASAFRFG